MENKEIKRQKKGTRIEGSGGVDMSGTEKDEEIKKKQDKVEGTSSEERAKKRNRIENNKDKYKNRKKQSNK